MKITVSLPNNLLPDKYGKYAAADNKKMGNQLLVSQLNYQIFQQMPKLLLLLSLILIQFLFVDLSGFTGLLPTSLALKLKFLRTSV